MPEVTKSAEEFLGNFVRADECNLYYFANSEGYYPTVQDLREKDLYHEVVRVSCAAMKWETPSGADWRRFHSKWIENYKTSSPTIDDFISAVHFKKRTKISSIPDENDRNITPIKSSPYFHNI